MRRPLKRFVKYSSANATHGYGVTIHGIRHYLSIRWHVGARIIHWTMWI